MVNALKKDRVVGIPTSRPTRVLIITGVICLTLVVTGVVVFHLSRKVDKGNFASMLNSSLPLTISVLGDSTGNNSSEWVSLWAQTLTADRTVTVHQWFADQNRFRPYPQVLGSGSAELEVWNASQPGARADFAAHFMSVAQPHRPDLVIYNFGHNEPVAEANQDFEAARTAVDQLWGSDVLTVVILQNLGLGPHRTLQEQTVAGVALWARQHGYRTIDVAAAFEGQGNAELSLDDRHPNAAGSVLWAETMRDALNQRRS